jgi:hypothetical protein
MFQVVGWNLVPKVCEICGQLKDKTDMVVDPWNSSIYYPACHDCTSGKIESDPVADAITKALKNFIYPSQPIYYYSTYWQKWDEILYYNKKTECIAVQEIGTNKIREHCTDMEKDFLSTAIVNRNAFNSFDEFKNYLKPASNKAWIIWRDSGIPRRLLKFVY